MGLPSRFCWAGVRRPTYDQQLSFGLGAVVRTKFEDCRSSIYDKQLESQFRRDELRDI